MTNATALTSQLDQHDRVNAEWSEHWSLARRAANVWVRKWIALSGMEDVICDVQDLVADTLDVAFEAYRNSFADERPRIVPAAIRAWIKSSARNRVRRAVRQFTFTFADLDNFPTGADCEPGEWLDFLWSVPGVSNRDMVIDVAVGFANGMTNREIAREIGISHTSVYRMRAVLKHLLTMYRQAWLSRRAA